MRMLFISILIFLSSCSGEVRDISAMEAYGNIRNNFSIIVDLREQSEDFQTPESARLITAKEILDNSKSWQELLEERKGRTLIFFHHDKEVAIDVASKVSKQHIDTFVLKKYDDWKNKQLPTVKRD